MRCPGQQLKFINLILKRKCQVSRSNSPGQIMHMNCTKNSVATTSPRLWTEHNQPGASSRSIGGFCSLFMPRQSWSFDIQHIRKSLKHYGNHGSANHAHAVLDAKHRITHSQERKTSHKHIAHNMPLDGKNDHRPDSGPKRYGGTHPRDGRIPWHIPQMLLSC